MTTTRLAEVTDPPSLRPEAPLADLRIAVLVPCYNEAAAIAQVIAGFRQALPSARILVFDNNSTDETVAIAQRAGAETRHVTRQGKGNVVRRMFADVEADLYVLVDGDATYDAASAPKLIAKLLADGLDMVVGARKDPAFEAYRPGHRFGNRVLTEFVARVFGRAFNDILSGYRVFSRRFSSRSCSATASTWWSARARTMRSRPIVPAIGSATAC